MGDTGGDHDLYDYCVDDPVDLNDPSGLKGESADEQQYGWFRRNLFGWTTKKGSEELVAVARKAMGAGQPDVGKDDAAEGGQYSRLRPWWTYPKTDPVYLKKHEEFLAAMAKEMGVGQPEDKAKKDNTSDERTGDKPNWLQRNIVPFYLPKGPTRDRYIKGVSLAIEERLRSGGLEGILEMNELLGNICPVPLPSASEEQKQKWRESRARRDADFQRRKNNHEQGR